MDLEGVLISADVFDLFDVFEAATSFEVVAHGEGWVVFANPAHDYPRRIRYERSRAGLVATIDDGEGGDARVWTMRRAR
jgi:hypothetical protein